MEMRWLKKWLDLSDINSCSGEKQVLALYDVLYDHDESRQQSVVVNCVCLSVLSVGLRS